MRSAFAEAIELFLADGGKITRCPEGNGLMPREYTPKQPVGVVKFLKLPAGERNRALVLEAMRAHGHGLTRNEIVAATGLTLKTVRLALENLTRGKAIATTQGIGRGRLYVIRVAA